MNRQSFPALLPAVLLGSGCLLCAASGATPGNVAGLANAASGAAQTAALPGSVAGLRGVSLRGTVVYSNPAQSLAMFEFGKDDSRTLRVGATLPGVGVLSRVDAKGVYFEANGALVRFTFNDSALNSGGTLISRAGPASAGAAIDGSAQAVIGAAQPYVMPDSNAGSYAGFHDADEARLDATPRPGETIDTTDWDNRGSQPARR